MNDVRFGVVGLGAIGARHVARLARPDTAGVLAAVCDADEARLDTVSQEFGVPGFSTLEELVASDDIDAVIISVPSGMHRDLSLIALKAGKHVLLEKPIDVNVGASDDVLAAAREAGKVISVVSQRRFAPPNQFLKKVVDEGVLGRVTSAAIEVPLWRTQEYYDSAGWRGTWAMDGGGALMNQGVHLVDLALWLLGDVDEVYAHTGLLAHERIEVEDTVTITARFKSGAFMTFLSTTAAQGPPPIRVSIMGDRGTIVTVNEEITHFTTDEGPRDLELLPTNGADPAGAIDKMQCAQLADFVEAVHGEHDPLVKPEEARNAVAFIEAVYESGRTGQPVKVAPLPTLE